MTRWHPEELQLLWIMSRVFLSCKGPDHTGRGAYAVKRASHSLLTVGRVLFHELCGGKWTSCIGRQSSGWGVMFQIIYMCGSYSYNVCLFWMLRGNLLWKWTHKEINAFRQKDEKRSSHGITTLCVRVRAWEEGFNLDKYRSQHIYSAPTNRMWCECYLKTRAPVVVLAKFAIWCVCVWAGICFRPLLTQTPIGLDKCGKKHLTALNRYVWKYFLPFFLSEQYLVH